MKNKDCIVSFLSVLSVSLFPILFLFFRNIEEAKLVDIIQISVIFILIGIVLFLVVELLIKDVNKSAIITSLILLLMFNFALIEKVIIKIFPMLYYWHVLLILLTIIVLASIFIKNKFSKELAENIRVVTLIVFSGLILFNGVSAIPTMIKKNSDIPTAIQSELAKGTIEVNSNVYYFIFDEYGGYENVLRYTGYDNTPFYAALEDLGFNVSKSSRGYTIQTINEIPNLLNLARINDSNMSYDLRRKNLENPLLFRLFKEHGYKLNLISDYGTIPTGEYVDYLFETEMYEDTLENFLIKNTVYYPFLINQYRNSRIVEVESIFQYMIESWEISHDKLFTFAYVEFPHLPWVVDENGNDLPLSEKQNWENPDTYLGQLKFASKKILEVVEVIIEKDPDAIIIIQSDHGYRRADKIRQDYEDLELEREFMKNVLNAVYYKGENVDIEAMSGLNTLYVVLNKFFGMDFKLIE